MLNYLCCVFILYVVEWLFLIDYNNALWNTDRQELAHTWLGLTIFNFLLPVLVLGIYQFKKLG